MTTPYGELLTPWRRLLSITYGDGDHVDSDAADAGREFLIDLLDLLRARSQVTDVAISDALDTLERGRTPRVDGRRR